jgi:hypothetical protein
MRRKTKRSNLETLFGVSKTPCTEQIKNIVDDIEPGALAGVFEEGLRLADEQGVLKDYRVVDGGVLIPLDGVWYHSSENIHCDHCLRQTKNGKTAYYHSMLGTAIVRPGSNVALPLTPEYIRNEDGSHKRREWNGRNHLECQYRRANGLESRCEGERLPVNCLELELWNEEKGTVAYKNSWITDGECQADSRTRTRSLEDRERMQQRVEKPGIQLEAQFWALEETCERGVLFVERVELSDPRDTGIGG